MLKIKKIKIEQKSCFQVVSTMLKYALVGLNVRTVLKGTETCVGSFCVFTR